MKRIMASVIACVSIGFCVYASYAPEEEIKNYKKDEGLYSQAWINRGADDIKRDALDSRTVQDAEKAEESETEEEAKAGTEKQTEKQTEVSSEAEQAESEKITEKNTEKNAEKTGGAEEGVVVQPKVQAEAQKQSEAQPQTETQPETQAQPQSETQPQTEPQKTVKKYRGKNDIENVQHMLRLRDYDAPLSGQLDKETKGKIKEYRKDKGLSGGGYIDDELLLSLGITSSSMLKNVQEKLKEKGYSTGTPDGIIGRRTLDEVESFKGDENLGEGSAITDDVLRKLGLLKGVEKEEKKEAGDGRVLTPNFKEDITDLPEKQQEKVIALDAWLNENLNTEKLLSGNKGEADTEYPYIIKQVLDTCCDILRDDDPDNKAEVAKRFRTLISYGNEDFNVAKFNDGEITRLYGAATEAVS